jgi:hypothetical protein
LSRASKLTLQYVYGLLVSGRLQAQKVDGKWLIDPAELGNRQRETVSA